MSDETKGATVIPGCRHDNVKDDTGKWVTPCPDCAAMVDLETWRRLHPPPEPPKSWVRRKADEVNGRDVPFALSEMLRETVEECCRVLEKRGCGADVHGLKCAMLEPKA